MNAQVAQPTVGTPFGNTEEAVAFLQRRSEHTGSFPVLTMVHMNPGTNKRGTVKTKSYPTEHGVIPWAVIAQDIDRNQGRANIYYALNPLLRPRDKKAERTDVSQVVSLHVDLDPRSGEDQDAAVTRIMTQVAGYKNPPLGS
jgi:hypothetical protein